MYSKKQDGGLRLDLALGVRVREEGNSPMRTRRSTMVKIIKYSVKISPMLGVLVCAEAAGLEVLMEACACDRISVFCLSVVRVKCVLVHQSNQWPWRPR
jgi:hypothetical protein